MGRVRVGYMVLLSCLFVLWVVPLLMAQEPAKNPSGRWTTEEKVLHQKATMLLKRWKQTASAQNTAHRRLLDAQLQHSQFAIGEATRALANADAVEREAWHDLQVFEMESRAHHGGQLPPWWPK
jgi:hypothetical protein